MHDHDHAVPGAALSAAGRDQSRLAGAFALISGFFIVELVAAVATGSLALLSDAGHMLGDIVGLGVTLAAVHVASATRRRPCHTYGLYRLEIMAALVNAQLLLAVSAYVLIEAVGRLRHPSGVDVAAGPMLVVAVLGLVVNVVALVLLRNRTSDSLTLEGATLEVLADTLGSLGAIGAAVVLLVTGWAGADLLVGTAVALFIIPRAVRLGWRALRVLIQAAPDRLDPAAVRAELAALDNVLDVHDLHLWSLTSGMDVASAHLMVPAGADTHRVLDQARDLLRERYAVAHATLQVEPDDHAGCDELQW
jgi:cobalt-zinc-cadmium efflux system protein